MTYEMLVWEMTVLKHGLGLFVGWYILYCYFMYKIKPHSVLDVIFLTMLPSVVLYLPIIFFVCLANKFIVISSMSCLFYVLILWTKKEHILQFWGLRFRQQEVN